MTSMGRGFDYQSTNTCFAWFRKITPRNVPSNDQVSNSLQPKNKNIRDSYEPEIVLFVVMIFHTTAKLVGEGASGVRNSTLIKLTNTLQNINAVALAHQPLHNHTHSHAQSGTNTPATSRSRLTQPRDP